MHIYGNIFLQIQKFRHFLLNVPFHIRTVQPYNIMLCENIYKKCKYFSVFILVRWAHKPHPSNKAFYLGGVGIFIHDILLEMSHILMVAQILPCASVILLGLNLLKTMKLAQSFLSFNIKWSLFANKNFT